MSDVISVGNRSVSAEDALGYARRYLQTPDDTEGQPSAGQEGGEQGGSRSQEGAGGTCRSVYPGEGSGPSPEPAGPPASAHRGRVAALDEVCPHTRGVAPQGVTPVRTMDA